MDSKQALRDLLFLAIGDENHIKRCEEAIEKDLDALEILRKYLYFDAKYNFIKMFYIKECITNIDFEIIKDWLEK